jgi:glycine/D-amino acid oxidase-like deaminating enzyme
MEQANQTQDLIIVGGGIMGLMTAYYAVLQNSNVVIIERLTIGNKEAASFSYTRSIRTDYLEPLYARLAYEAQLLWLELEQKSKNQLFNKCGCLNIAKSSITPNIEGTYAQRSFEVARSLHYQPEKYSREELRKKFPQFEADFGTLDTKGGFLQLPAITEFILGLLKERGVTFLENTEITSIEEQKDYVILTTNKGLLQATKLVVTAGKGTNGVISRIKNTHLVFPISYERPQRRYYYPAKDKIDMFMPDKFPVFAYTDVGIYGHPIFDKKKGAVKIAFFVPVGVQKDDRKIKCVEDFVAICLPVLSNARSEEITDADNCWYDIVADDDFILGGLPGFEHIVVGTGWRGTGYKFAPLIGKILSQLALQNGTVFDIQQFNPGRFQYESKK